MTVHLYTVVWNEEDMLEFLFNHYDSWVDRYVIYDDGSIDKTIEKLHSHPKVEVRPLHRSHPDSVDLSKQELFNTAWKESRGEADWVIIIDADEHLFIPNCPMQEYLQQCTNQGVTLLPALGYQMISENFPKHDETLCQTITTGAPLKLMSKTCLFNPDAIEEINSSLGNHWAWPTGRLKLTQKDELLLLHYKFLGFTQSVERYAHLKTRRGKQDMSNKWGVEYFDSSEILQEKWNQIKINSIDISQSGSNPNLSHRASRWWRPNWKFFIRCKLAYLFTRVFGKFPNLVVRSVEGKSKWFVR